MTIQNTNNETVQVSKQVHAYLVRKYCDSLSPMCDTPKGNIQQTDIYGNLHNFELLTCFTPIYEKYKEAAKRKYQTSLKYKYK